MGILAENSSPNPALLPEGTWQKGGWKTVGSRIPEGHCETVSPEQAA